MIPGCGADGRIIVIETEIAQHDLEGLRLSCSQRRNRMASRCPDSHALARQTKNPTKTKTNEGVSADYTFVLSSSVVTVWSQEHCYLGIREAILLRLCEQLSRQAFQIGCRSRLDHDDLGICSRTRDHIRSRRPPAQPFHLCAAPRHCEDPAGQGVAGGPHPAPLPAAERGATSSALSLAWERGRGVRETESHRPILARAAPSDASLKVVPIAITSPTLLHLRAKRWSTPGNFSKAQRGSEHT